MNAGMGAYFDAVAEQGIWHDFESNEQECVERYLRMWAIKPGSRVIEPGCGRGRLTERLSKAVGPNGEVVGVDISAEMIAAAKRRGLPANSRFLNRSFLDVSPAAGTFDYVVCCNVWPHFTDPDQAIRHAYALLSERGHLYIAHLCGRERINQVHRGAGHVVADHLLPSADDLAGLVMKHGFSITGLEDTDEVYWLQAEREVAVGI